MQAKLPTPHNLAYFILVGGLCPKCWVRPVEENMRGFYCDKCWAPIHAIHARINDDPRKVEWKKTTDAWEKALFPDTVREENKRRNKI